MKLAFECEVGDVAAYIILRTGDLRDEKLHILLYFCQIWSLQWDQHRLFAAKIAASSEGPRIEGIRESVAKRLGRSSKLGASARDTVDRILNFYGNKSAERLTELVFAEKPFQAAWLSKSTGGGGEIGIKSIAAFANSRANGLARTGSSTVTR